MFIEAKINLDFLGLFGPAIFKLVEKNQIEWKNTGNTNMYHINTNMHLQNVALGIWLPIYTWVESGKSD